LIKGGGEVFKKFSFRTYFDQARKEQTSFKTPPEEDPAESFLISVSSEM